MPTVPIGIQAYKRSAGFYPESELVNMFLEKDETGASPDGTLRLQRPGFATLATALSPIRGMYRRDRVFSGSIFAVSGGQFGRVDGSSVTELGGVSDDGQQVDMAAAFDRLFFLSVNNLYSWNGTVITPIAIPDGRVSATIDVLNNYLIVGCTDGRFYWLEPGQATIDPLNFANAESSPDGLIAVRRLIDELFMFGSGSTEVWQATGNLDAPFQKAGGRQFDRGCLARNTVHRFDNSLVWVGDDALVYTAQSVATELTGDGIAERLAKRTDLPTAWVFGAMRHKFYCLRIPGQGTFGYDPSTQQWSEFASDGQTTWRAHVGVQDSDVAYAGDWLTGAIWRLDPDAYNDAGTPMRRAVSGTAPQPVKPVRNDSFALGVGCSADCTIKVRWRDGPEKYPAFFEELEARAPVDTITAYRLGQIEQSFRTFQIEVTDNVQVRFAGLMINEAWQ
jgi:hypothetical protein